MKPNSILSMAALLAACATCAPGAEKITDAPPVVLGMEELCRPDLLPAFTTAIKVGSVSSYDRSGGNDDGFSGKYSFVRKEPEGLVLADLQGPGVIYRIWTPTPSDDDMEFFFDGEAAPRVTVKFRDFFLGKYPAFPKPLVGYGAGGFYSYVPMPFAKSCKIRMRAPKVQFYQINYAIYPAQTPLASFSLEPSPEYAAQRDRACRLFAAAGSNISAQVAPPGAKLSTERKSVIVKPGKATKVYETRQPGRLVGLRLEPASALAGKARDLMLRIAFDGGAPSVNCPLGDFFGYAWGQPAMKSLFIGTSGEVAYCHFPMPFARSATVEITSERAGEVELRAEVMHAALPRQPWEGGFCAVWRRENPTRTGEPFTFIETTGRGHLVGAVLQAQGFESGKTLFFEGDDQTYLDGELVIHGTGSEDFFNGGWYDVPDRWEKRISFPLSGCLGYAKHLGRTGGYRFMIGDKYAFQKSLRQVMEHAGEKNSISTDYAAVSYLYLQRPPAPAMATPALKERAVSDLGEVIFPAWWQLPIYAWSFDNASLARKHARVGGEDVRFLSLAATNNDWFGLHFISLTCDVPASGVYEIQIEAVLGPAQGKVQLFQDEVPIGEAVDLYAAQLKKSGRLTLGRQTLAEGKNQIMLKLVGRNEQSTGLGLDLVQLACVKSK